ncbi:hypothetical protein JXM83_05015 [Candidatus Woesearchaeota archaeon]|nr:hypothetical protein [Candidatus Woesearchaeota archaeon]
MDEKTLKVLEKKSGPLELLISLNVSRFSVDDLVTAESMLELQKLVQFGQYDLARDKYPAVLKMVEVNPDIRINGVTYLQQFYDKIYMPLKQ